jgi:hypothetical protein
MGVKVEKENQPQGKWVLKNGNKPLDLRTLPRCRATAKSTGFRCGNPAMNNKKVCYLHGGKSPGPPKGNQNAFKHGYYTAESVSERRYTMSLIRKANSLIEKLKG